MKGKIEGENKSKDELQRYKTFSYKQSQHENKETNCDALTW